MLGWTVMGTFRRIHVLVSEFSIFNYFYVPQGPPGLPGLGGPKGEKVSR